MAKVAWERGSISPPRTGVSTQFALMRLNLLQCADVNESLALLLTRPALLCSCAALVTYNREGDPTLDLKSQELTRICSLSVQLKDMQLVSMTLGYSQTHC